MRILIATTHRAVVGGVETYLRAVLPLLAGRGHELALLYERAATDGAARIDDRLVGVSAWCAESANPGVALRKAVRWRPDVVYAHGLESPDVEEALLDKFPVVLFAHNYHGTCVSGTKRHALPSARPCSRRLGLGCLVRYYPCRCGGLDPRTLWRLYRAQRRRQALLPRYRAVAVASRHMREEYRRHGVPDGWLRLLPLFPPVSAPDPEPPPGRSCGGHVQMVGRLTDLKGGMILIESMRKAQAALGRPLTLTVAGDGPERGAMEAAAARTGQRAVFTGWVDSVRRTELMREADLLAVPSVWPEPFGLVGIEAGCVGLPAAAFDVGGVRDWLRPGVSGELAPGDPPTADGLAAAIVRALADPARLNRLRIGAWEVARAFRPERHVNELERILDAARPAAGGDAFMLKSLLRRATPRWLWSRLRTWKMRRMLANFRPYTAEHTYAGVRLKVRIADTLAGGWYDHDWGPLPEIDLLRQGALIPGACVFDLGAHQGVVAMILAHHAGPSGQIIAVEALPHNARMAEINRDLNGFGQIRVEAAAVSDRPGELEISTGLNGQVKHGATDMSTTCVAAVTVDGLAVRYGLPDVLFIDVEGYECHVLRGAGRTLERRPDCYVEVHGGCGLEQAGGSVANVFRLLPASDYEFLAWTEASPTPTVVKGPADCPPARFFLVARRRGR